MKLKVGDRVVIKDYDAMARQYGVDNDGYVTKRPMFSINMKHLCGRTATIE